MPRDLAIDLGTANTVVAVAGRGVVLDEHTVLALDERTGEVVAIGDDALARAGGSQGVVIVRPIRRGAMTDFELTERLLRTIFSRVGTGRFLHPRAIVAVSRGLTRVEQRAVREAVTSAGARSVVLIAKPIAAAIGAGLAIEQPFGTCVTDVGSDTTEVAIIALGSVVASATEPVGGADIDAAIRQHLRREHDLTVTEAIAEDVKRSIGSAAPLPDEPKAEIAGRDGGSGIPRTVIVSAEEIRDVLDPIVVRIVGVVRRALASTPPDLAHDVLQRGITLTGGGALLRGLDRRISAETDISVHVTQDPLHTVCLGAARALQDAGRRRDHDIFLRP